MARRFDAGLFCLWPTEKGSKRRSKRQKILLYPWIFYFIPEFRKISLFFRQFVYPRNGDNNFICFVVSEQFLNCFAPSAVSTGSFLIRKLMRGGTENGESENRFRCSGVRQQIGPQEYQWIAFKSRTPLNVRVFRVHL